MAPFSLYSALLLTRARMVKVVHYRGNRVPLRTQTVRCNHSHSRAKLQHYHQNYGTQGKITSFFILFWGRKTIISCFSANLHVLSLLSLFRSPLLLLLCLYLAVSHFQSILYFLSPSNSSHSLFLSRSLFFLPLSL